MEKLDESTVAVLAAANISDEVLPSLTREDLRDLLPGPENFLKRKLIWDALHSEPEEPPPASAASTKADDGTSGDRMTQASTLTPKNVTPKKIMRITSPDYVIYTDTELEQVRKYYFELQRCGRAHECMMSKELRCRLVRNTMTSMISILRANEMEGRGDSRYPSREELSAMARRLTDYYPMLKDKDGTKQPWETILRQLIKRQQNVKSPHKMSPSAETLRPKKRRLEYSLTNQPDCDVSPGINDLPMAHTSQVEESMDHDSRQAQARHYKTLQEILKRPRPNHNDVAHLLDLEFESRRAFIDSDLLKEEDRVAKIVEAYPCFRDHKHIMEELRRILDRDNPRFLDMIREQWESFRQSASFFGVWNKSLKPPLPMDKEGQAIALMRALPVTFPSPLVPSKRLGAASEALFHVLEPSEDPETFLEKRHLSSPIFIVDSDNLLLSVGPVPLTTMPKELLHEAPLILMGCYYTFHLTYPRCISTLLSVIQTEVLKDSIHERDLTHSYKKAMSDWRAFTKK